ncbi:OprO/OprP family phosphate-selective porin [Shewanella phaeophyticola]|uniref:OprO/OprP family phosphate-selective porin n=1 Tax=Shewanella phaeophyticola TaxID=2978345 RepID=A0ABT2P0Y1_9GAMM|nr:OprO/OprP family phosphate-selective porin [Shewanella sp. KJ10-1]MCT8986309.1 OprO/OprP family phosphate-selective porin [Shewanella sp. KJ10-1]
MKTVVMYIAPALLVLAANATAEEYPELSFGGYIMLDHDQFSDIFLEDEQHSNNGTDIRRARLSAKAKLSDDWRSKFQVDIADGEIDIKDAYVQYKGFDWANITLGQQKEPFGLEKLTSSRDTFMIERSMVTEALAPGRNIGVKLSGSPGDFTWDLGYFQEANSQNSYGVTGRLTWAVIDDDDNFFHLGSALSERRLEGDEFRINETLEVYSSDSLLEGTRLDAEDMSLAGIELMWQYQGVVSMAEWIETDIDDPARGTYHYQGGYYQMSYPLSGKNRHYKNGKLGTIKAEHDWELTWRMSQFELEQENRKAQTFAVGVNYLVNEDLMFKANYIRAKYQDDGVTDGYDNAFSLRAQYSF